MMAVVLTTVMKRMTPERHVEVRLDAALSKRMAPLCEEGAIKESNLIVPLPLMFVHPYL